MYLLSMILGQRFDLENEAKITLYNNLQDIDIQSMPQPMTVRPSSPAEKA